MSNKENFSLSHFTSVKIENIWAIRTGFFACLVGLLFGGFGLWQAKKSHENAAKRIYVLDKNSGLVIAANVSEALQYKNIEVKAHVRNFLEKFYQYAEQNYDAQIAAGQELCNNEVAMNIKNNLEKMSVRKEVLKGMQSFAYIDKIEVEKNKDGTFDVVAIFRQHLVAPSGQAVYRYKFKMQVADLGERTEQNPHALLITALEAVDREKVKLEK